MMNNESQNHKEFLARLRILSCIVKADGDSQGSPVEKVATGSVGLAVVIAIALVVFSGGSVRGDQSVVTKSDATALLSAQDIYQNCAKALLNCKNECDATIAYCISKPKGLGHKHDLNASLLQDCADLCALSANVVSRNGPLTSKLCEVNAEFCTTVAQECEKFFEDQTMNRCAVECRKTAVTCREMAGYLSDKK